MPSIDQHTTINPVVAFAITAQTATTADGITIDTQGFESLEYMIFSGTMGGSATITPNLQESDDGATWSDVDDSADGFVLGTEANATFVAADSDTIKRIGTVGKKQFQRIQLTVATATSTVGVVGMLGHARHQPTEGS